jgi:phosphonopyruvate decarboxylase
MLDPQGFIDELFECGIRFVSGVPCSFLKSFINTVQSDSRMRYVIATNEASAVAAASGAFLGGCRSAALMQNSGLGNAVNPLVSLNHVFRIPVLLFITLRGERGVPDEPQHELMGRITTDMLDTMRIPWKFLPPDTDKALAALKAACEEMDRSCLPFALVIKKGTFVDTKDSHVDVEPLHKVVAQVAEYGFGNDPALRRDILKAVVRGTPAGSTALIATTGFTGRELYGLEDRANQFYMVGSMGCAAPLGLGLALCCPKKKVVVLDGDGAVLMHMGALAMIGRYKPGNFVHIVLDNRIYESTGGQPTVSGSVALAEVALATGYRKSFSGTSAALVQQAMGKDGPVFAHIVIRPGFENTLPRPTITPPDQKSRFMQFLGGGGK